MGEIWSNANKNNEIWANGQKIKEVWSGNNKVWSSFEPIFVFANNYNNYIYISKDICHSFTKTTGKGYGVAIGNNIIVSAGILGNSQVSYDFGTTWNSLSGLDKSSYFYNVCYCADNKMFYTISTLGKIYKTDGISSWIYLFQISDINYANALYYPRIVYGNGVFMVSGNYLLFNCGNDCTSINKKYYLNYVTFVDFSDGNFYVGNDFYLLKMRRESDGSYNYFDYISKEGEDDGYGYRHMGATLTDNHLISAYKSNYSGATNDVSYDDSGTYINETISLNKCSEVISSKATISRVLSYKNTVIICGYLVSSYSSSYNTIAVSYDYGHTWKNFNNYLCFSDAASNTAES